MAKLLKEYTFKKKLKQELCMPDKKFHFWTQNGSIANGVLRS